MQTYFPASPVRALFFLACAFLCACGAPPPTERSAIPAATTSSLATVHPPFALNMLEYDIAKPEPTPAVSPSEAPSARALRLVAEATDRCASVTFSDDGFVRKGERLVARPAALCAWSERTHTWHTVFVRIPFFSKADWSRPKEWREAQFVVEVLTPGEYQVSRVEGSGFGPSRLAFDVSFRGEHLTVYRVRHVWFDRAAFESGLASRMLAARATVDLTPLHPDFHGIGLPDIAIDWLFGEVAAIRAELDLREVSSSAFRTERITEVIPATLLFSIPLIEHIDQETYMGTATCNKEPTCVSAAQHRAIEGALIVYALNRETGNRFSVSSSGAIGAWQFMNSKRNPTYDAVVRSCPSAAIDPSFPEGAQTFHNGGKAAMCLLDLNLGYLPEVHTLFRRNPVLGGIYLLAAYNGGPRAAHALFREVHQKHPDVEAEDIVLPSVLRVGKGATAKSLRPRAGSHKKRTSYTALAARLNGETPGYAHKFLTLLEYLALRDAARE